MFGLAEKWVWISDGAATVVKFSNETNSCFKMLQMQNLKYVCISSIVGTELTIFVIYLMYKMRRNLIIFSSLYL